MKKVCFIISFFLTVISNAQDIDFGKKIVDTLTSPYFWGRGYTNNGMQKAADFLATQFKAYKLQTMKGKNYFQSFNYSVNTFPGNMYFSIDNQTLIPGKDFIIDASSCGVSATGYFKQKDSTTYVDQKNRVLLTLNDKLTMTVSPSVLDYTLIEVNKKAIMPNPFTYKINIENSFVKKFNAVNVCGMVKGTIVPDSFIVITAHYDHLGGLGKDTYFPGANDNASGVALLLNLARYYALHPQKYSISFILFSGEEIGLLGSKYFTENPLLPLNKIRFLINTDLAGTGDDGITVVNATEFPKEFEWMQQLNTDFKLLKAVNARGKAANSDHHFFTEKGVPSFFFYTLGGVSYYHDILDKSETLPLNEHEDLYKLLIKFNEKLMGF